MTEPTVKLEADGVAPVISYNVPEPTSYSGRNFIALDLDKSWFRTGFTPAGPAAPPPAALSATSSREAVPAAVRAASTATRSLMADYGGSARAATAVLAPESEQGVPEKVVRAEQADQVLMAVRSISGALALRALPRLRPNEPDDPPSGPGLTELLVRITSPHHGDVISGPATGVTLAVTGTAEVISGPGSIEAVEVRVGAGVFRAARPAAPGDFTTWSFSEVVSAFGPLSITARARHSSGALTRQTSVSIKVAPGTQPPQSDTTPPLLGISSPADDGTVVLGPNGSATIEVTGSATDTGSGVHQVAVSLDDVAVPNTPRAPNDWSNWRAAATVSGAGAHTIRVLATDKAGNFARATRTVTAASQQPPVPILHRLLLVEDMRLSSFLGAYGAGRTIKTFSLLPGERTKISIKTYLRTATDAKRASSILDSFTEESATDFQTTMENEQSSKNLVEESSNYKVGAEANAHWGWGSAKVSAEASGGTNAAREELAKNIATATQKHAARASSKRDVQVNTSFEVKEEAGEETSIERQIENINLSRTLNFVFRQMNQEFISLLHLVDVRIGYFRVDAVPGQAEPVTTYREATLPQLDGLLAEVIVPAHREEVRDTILHQLQHVFDYQDGHHCLVETKTMTDDSGAELPNSSYLRIRKDLVSRYEDPATGTQVSVPGVILAVVKNVLRTDGVIVEALLGQGDALDEYAQRLQQLEVNRREAEQAQEAAKAEQAALVNQVVRDGDTERARLLAELICRNPASPPTLIVRLESNGSKETERDAQPADSQRPV